MLECWGALLLTSLGSGKGQSGRLKVGKTRTLVVSSLARFPLAQAGGGMQQEHALAAAPAPVFSGAESQPGALVQADSRAKVGVDNGRPSASSLGTYSTQ